MRYALAVDGGGTKCDAIVVDDTGQVLGWGRGGDTHAYYSSPEAVNQAFEQAISQALGDLETADGVWVSGPIRRGPLREVVERHGPIRGVAPGGEVDTAFASVQEAWGMIVLAGTGSFVYGLTAEGNARHFGGMGPILGDYGSGYQVGLYGLRAAFASRWTEARRTTLEQAVPAAWGLPDLHAVFDRVYNQGVNRKIIAGIARIVNREAEAGDRIANGCLTAAADELGALAVDMVKELELQDLEFPMIAVGSVAQKSRIWWGRMCERVREAAPRVRPLVPRVKPVVGGALLALREMGVAWTPELLQRIEETQQPFLAAIESEEASSIAAR